MIPIYYESTKSFSTKVTSQQWELIKDLKREANSGERKATYDKVSKLFGEYSTKLLSMPENAELAKKLTEYCHEEVRVKVISDLKDNTSSYYTPIGEVHVGSNPLSAVLAHEIGHAMCDQKLGGKIGKLTHTTYAIGPLSKMGNSVVNISNILALIFGLKFGSAAVIFAPLIPYILYSPTLIQEHQATSLGLQLLKKFGASEDYIKVSKKLLKLAYGTYVSFAGNHRWTALFSSMLGRIIRAASFSNSDESNKSYSLLTTLLSLSKLKKSEAIKLKGEVIKNVDKLLLKELGIIHSHAFKNRSTVINTTATNQQEFIKSLKVEKITIDNLANNKSKQDYYVCIYLKDTTGKFLNNYKYLVVLLNSSDALTQYTYSNEIEGE